MRWQQKTTLIWVAAGCLASWDAHAFQQDFPTAEPGFSVSYTVADIPGSRSACVVVISRGLPTLAFSFNIFSDNEVNVVLAWTDSIPEIKIGKTASIRINDAFVKGVVIDRVKKNPAPFNVISMRVSGSEPGISVMHALTQIIIGNSGINISADGVALPGVALPPAPSLNAALLECVRFKEAR